MKKFTCVIISILMVIISIITLCGCGNNTLSISGKTYKYASVNESGQYIIHSIEAWEHDENGCILIETDCCKMLIYSSSENIILYEKAPENLSVLHCSPCNKLNN